MITLILIGWASFRFLRCMRTGFENNMAIVRRLEISLLLCETGAYLDTKPILDANFAQIKNKPITLVGQVKHAIMCTEHFSTLNFLLIAVYLPLLVLTFWAIGIIMLTK